MTASRNYEGSGRSSSETTSVMSTETLTILLESTKAFYDAHRDLIKESHGLSHAKQVFDHACHAIRACHPPLNNELALEIQMAALLHDIDDTKYFVRHIDDNDKNKYPNASRLLQYAKVPERSIHSILFMIDLVSCSKNGNRVPESIHRDHSYHFLIPRWADRIEAVGARGVWRCYQYNQEHGAPLSSDVSPRPQSVLDLWSYATPDRFEAYQQRGGSSTDMISHYYDKLLHVACPPREIVQNVYLEERLRDSAKELITLCLQYGETGVVNEAYIQNLAC